MLGCGAVARAVHLPLLRRLRGAHLVAVADPSPSARAAAARVARVEVGDDPLALVRDGRVDAVVVCSPSATHAALGLAVLEAGKHLYLEKPLATTSEEGLRLVEAAAATGRVAAIGFNRRFHPAYVRIRAAVEKGRLGPVREVCTAFHEPIAAHLPEWKRRRATGGGALLDLASHHLDLLRHVLRTELELHSATIRSLASEHDDGELRVRLTCGGEARVVVSFHRERMDEMVLSGARGTLRADRHGGLRGRLRPHHDPSYRLALEAFVARARGASVPLPGLDDGLRSLELVLAAEAASS